MPVHYCLQFIEFNNAACNNLCLWSDGCMDDLNIKKLLAKIPDIVEADPGSSSRSHIKIKELYFDSMTLFCLNSITS